MIMAYFSGANVTGGEDVLELVGEEEFLELVRDVDGPLRDMQVADDEHELRKHSYTISGLHTSPSLIAIMIFYPQFIITNLAIN